MPLLTKGIIGGMIQLGMFSAFMLIPATMVPGGTWLWDRAIIFLIVYGLISQVVIIVMAKKAPANLEARLKPPLDKKQPLADRIITAAMIVVGIIWFIINPLDHFYFKLFQTPPLIVSSLGGIVCLLGYAIMLKAILKNAFAIPNVQDQTDKGQTLVSTGLYGRVRHPFYTGIILFFVGLSLWLESYAGTIATILWIAILVARIIIEEKVLNKTLPDYKQYTKKVKYRLIPFIW